MIDVITGQIAAVHNTHVVVMVGGVGLRVLVPKTVFDAIDGRGER